MIPVNDPIHDQKISDKPTAGGAFGSPFHFAEIIHSGFLLTVVNILPESCLAYESLRLVRLEDSFAKSRLIVAFTGRTQSGIYQLLQQFPPDDYSYRAPALD